MAELNKDQGRNDYIPRQDVHNLQSLTTQQNYRRQNHQPSTQNQFTTNSHEPLNRNNGNGNNTPPPIRSFGGNPPDNPDRSDDDPIFDNYENRWRDSRQQIVHTAVTPRNNFKVQLPIFKADGDAHIHVNIFKLATEGVPNLLKIAAFIGQHGTCANRRFKGNLGSKFSYAKMIDSFFKNLLTMKLFANIKQNSWLLQ